MTFSSDDDRITFFFDSPNNASHARAGLHSVLYLLRRELLETMGFDPNSTSEHDAGAAGPRNRMFASLILMFTVVELLAKFAYGDASGNVGARFRAFLASADGGELVDEQALQLYKLRSSLVHAFGVPDADTLATLGLSGFSLAQRSDSGLIMQQTPSGVAVVYIDGIYRVVIAAVEKYRETLYGSGSSDRRALLLQMFAKYGTIVFRGN